MFAWCIFGRFTFRSLPSLTKRCASSLLDWGFGKLRTPSACEGGWVSRDHRFDPIRSWTLSRQGGLNAILQPSKDQLLFPCCPTCRQVPRSSGEAGNFWSDWLSVSVCLEHLRALHCGNGANCKECLTVLTTLGVKLRCPSGTAQRPWSSASKRLEQLQFITPSNHGINHIDRRLNLYYDAYAFALRNIGSQSEATCSMGVEKDCRM